MAASLEVRALSVGYGPVRALREVSVDVPEGRIVAVLGGNGAGKSTLLRAISRTLTFSAAGSPRAPSTSRAARWTGSARHASWPPVWSKCPKDGRCSHG